MLFIGKQKKYARQAPKNKAGLGFTIVHKIVPFIIIAIGLQIASSKCARQLNYNEELVGKPLFYFKGEPFYPPWAIIEAYITTVSKFYKGENEIVYKNAMILLPTLLIAIIIYYLLVYVRTLTDDEDKNFMNTGRWATKKDLKENGLLADRGVVIGQLEEAYVNGTMMGGSCKLTVVRTAQLLQFNMNVCAMVLAGSRLGKGVSTVS